MRVLREDTATHEGLAHLAAGRERWVDVDASNMSGVFKRYPDRGELASEINESLIVELYSK